MIDYYSHYLKAVDAPLPEMKKTFELESVLLSECINLSFSKSFSKIFSGLYNDSKQPIRVLDMGCGVGRPILDLAMIMNNKAHFYGVDNDSACITEANIRKQNIGAHMPAILRNVIFKKGNLFEMQNSDFFNLTYSTFNLIGSLPVEKQKDLISLKHKVAKSNSLIVTVSWNNNNYTTDFLEEYYPSIGIDIQNMDREKTTTSLGTFYRVNPKKVSDLYNENNIRTIGIVDLNLWNAVVGLKID